MSDPGSREFRAWVKANHPDRGGDPEAFAEGLRRWRAPRPAAGDDATAGRAQAGPGQAGWAPVEVYRRRRGVARWVAGSLRRHRLRRERAGRVR